MLNEINEAEILGQIKDSEKKAEKIIENANIEKETVLQDAIKSSSELLSKRREEIRKLQEKKIMDSKSKVKSLKEEKLKEGKKTVNQIKKKAEKNINKAVEFVMKKFNETM